MTALGQGRDSERCADCGRGPGYVGVSYDGGLTTKQECVHMGCRFIPPAPTRPEETTMPTDTAAAGRAAAIRGWASNVIAAIDRYGPTIIPHLMDNDDNDGQRLREALDYESDFQPWDERRARDAAVEVREEWGVRTPRGVSMLGSRESAVEMAAYFNASQNHPAAEVVRVTTTVEPQP